MAGLSADESAAETNQAKKRPRTELSGDEHEEAEGKKCCRTEELPAEVTCQEEEKKKTTRRRYSQEYIDDILSWNTDWKIPDVQMKKDDDEEVSEETRRMRLYAISYFTELRARKMALQDFVRAQVADHGYAEMPEEATEPPKEYDDDGEELIYLGFGIYDE